MEDVSRDLLEKLINRIIDYSKFAPRFANNFSNHDLEKLRSLQCHEPIQPALLSLTLAPPNPVLVYSGSSESYIKRAYCAPSTLDKLREHKLIGSCISAQEAAYVLNRHRSRYPTTVNELETMLDQYKVSGKREEHAFLECKGPKKVLTERMTKDVAKAVCAMLNTGPGWVIIGVRDRDKQIVGFEPRYGQGSSFGFEVIQPIISQRINKIRPCPAGRFEPWVIDLGNGKVVVIISVLKGKEGVNYSFDVGKGSKVYVRQGPESVESDRDCSP